MEGCIQHRWQQGRAHDYRGAGAQTQKRAACVRAERTPNFFPGPLHNMEINVKLKNKVLIES